MENREGVADKLINTFTSDFCAHFFNIFSTFDCQAKNVGSTSSKIFVHYASIDFAENALKTRTTR